MDSIIDVVLTKGSPLAVLVAVVWFFLKFISKENGEHRAFLKTLTDEHIDARRESRMTIEKNSEALHENTKAMVGLSESVNRGGNFRKL